jgi:hypothetical protein
MKKIREVAVSILESENNELMRINAEKADYHKDRHGFHSMIAKNSKSHTKHKELHGELARMHADLYHKYNELSDLHHDMHYDEVRK